MTTYWRVTTNTHRGMSRFGYRNQISSIRIDERREETRLNQTQPWPTTTTRRWFICWVFTDLPDSPPGITMQVFCMSPRNPMHHSGVTATRQGDLINIAHFQFLPQSKQFRWVRIFYASFMCVIGNQWRWSGRGPVIVIYRSVGWKQQRFPTSSYIFHNILLLWWVEFYPLCCVRFRNGYLAGRPESQ